MSTGGPCTCASCSAAPQSFFAAIDTGFKKDVTVYAEWQKSHARVLELISYKEPSSSLMELVDSMAKSIGESMLAPSLFGREAILRGKTATQIIVDDPGYASDEAAAAWWRAELPVRIAERDEADRRNEEIWQAVKDIARGT